MSQKMIAMRMITTAAAVGSMVLTAAVAGSGCKKTDDNTANFKAALNTYYASRPACLWNAPVKFPVQVTTSDQDQTQGYDALVDQGLLARTTAEKKVFILGSKQVTNYDLTDKGRAAWTPDTQMPGSGNFCYGKPSVTTIDSSTPTTSEVGAKTTVNYHVSISGAPGWASAAETQTAFPQIRTQLAGPMAGVATLTDTSSGWAVTSGPANTPVGAPAPGNNASGSRTTAADGQIVQ